MKRSPRLFLFGQSRPLFVCYRYFSNESNKKYKGIKETFDENQARLYFDKWLKSLWLAPSTFIDHTKRNSITIKRCYLPFWNLSLDGSVNALIQVEKKRASMTGRPPVQWHSGSLRMNNICLNDINIYAAQTLNRYYLDNLNISFDNNQVVNLNNQEEHIEEWTVDKDTAFHIGWDLNIIPEIKYLCIEQAKQTYPKCYSKIESFHFDINIKKERLLYYPVYVINYKYDSQSNFTCLVDGLSGQVVGDRQYSMTKVTLATLIGFYPILNIIFTAVDSLKTLLVIDFIVSFLVGICAKYYPKIYRQRINRQQWQNYRSNASQFTYDFTTPFQQQRREDVLMDLYNLLSINRTAIDREIKVAYLLKAKEFHPDRNPDDKKAEELFKKINQAYSILSDKYKRKQYDKHGYESVKYN